MHRGIMYSIAVGIPGTSKELYTEVGEHSNISMIDCSLFAFQQRQASEMCYRMFFALFGGIVSRIFSEWLRSQSLGIHTGTSQSRRRCERILDGVHLAKLELDVRIDHELGEPNDLTTKMEGISEA